MSFFLRTDVARGWSLAPARTPPPQEKTKVLRLMDSLAQHKVRSEERTDLADNLKRVANAPRCRFGGALVHGAAAMVIVLNVLFG